MKEATKNEEDHTVKESIFSRTLSLLHPLGRTIVNGKNNQFSTSLYDGVFNGISYNIDYYETKNKDEINAKIELLKEDNEFKQASGVGSNYKERTKKRIQRALEIFSPDE